MGARSGCGGVKLGCLFLMVAVLVFAALATALVLTGEVPLYAPRLTGFEPEPGFAFQPTTPITLTFDQPMDPASVQGAFALIPAVAGQLHWNGDRTQFTFVPEAPGYEPGQEYRVRLAPGIKAGTLPRTTEQGIEWDVALQPLLDSSRPPHGQMELDALPQLEATFNYSLDCSRTLQTFAITPEVAGQPMCDGRTLTFSPTQPLAPGTSYIAAFAHVFLQDEPSPRTGPAWSFTTAPPLVVIDASPAAQEFVEDFWAPVRITFNRSVLPESATSRFSLAPQDGPAVSGESTWEDGGATLVFQPDPALKPATRYEIFLQAGVQDELGFELSTALSSSFDTADMLDQPSPAPDSSDVALDSAIRLPFTRAMDKASVEAGLVISPALEATPAWKEDTLILTPHAGLLASTTYHLALLADVRDATGAPLAADRRWAFGTEAFLLDTELPPTQTVLMELQQPISLTFALPMDQARLRSALTISPETPGDLIWSDDGRTVTFQPNPAWLSGTSYEISLSGTARAEGGQEMGQDRTWSFGTGQTQVQFGEGPNVQTMDAGGDRAFQVIAQGADVADFYLYAITPTQFLELYSPGFQDAGSQPAPILDTSTPTPTLMWREALTDLEGEGRDGWHTSEAHLPVQVAPGMYVLASTPPGEDTGEGQGNSYLLVILTRHTLVLKEALAGSGEGTQAQVVAWDTEIGTGAPVVSATVRLYDRDGTFLAEGLTGPDGLVTLDVPGDPGPLFALSASPSRVEEAEERQTDVTLCGLSEEWITEGLRWWWSPQRNRPLYLVYSYTDRPSYHGGQIIYFKEVIRASDGVSYTLPAPDLPITVRLRDAHDNIAATQMLTPTVLGTVAGEFQLADDPLTGTWHLETEIGDSVSRQPFRIEEYRKPEFQVAVATPREAYVQGQTISVTVDAAYDFGQPVEADEVDLRVYPSSDYRGEGENHFGSPVKTVHGTTDAEGRWTTVLATDDLDWDGNGPDSLSLALEATITSPSGQSVSSFQTVVVYRTSQVLSLVLERHGYQPGEEIAFSAQALDRDGEAVAGTTLTVQVRGWDDEQVTSATATTGQEGQAQFALSLAEQGWYYLVVSGTDEGGREISASGGVWVYDPDGQAPWYQSQWGKPSWLSLGADQYAYAPGGEAQVMIYSPVAGPALLSLERGQIYDAEPIELLPGMNVISLPIRSEYAPNIVVRVDQYGPTDTSDGNEQTQPEAALLTASMPFSVPMPEKQLTVTLTPGSATYAPGDEATLHVLVTDHQGQPVMAEVSMAVVDEAMYTLAGNLAQDPFAVFYMDWPNIVDTYDSLRPIRQFWPERSTGSSEEAVGTPRRTFFDTAYWAPTVMTGEDGEAEVAFTLPDTLTEWRALARAVTTDTLVGQGTAQVTVSQELVVRSALPHTLVQSDAITLTAVVHSFTTQPVSATVELDLQGLALPGDPAYATSGIQVVGVPAAGSAPAEWPVVAEEPGEASVALQAVAGRGARVVGRDSVELPLIVKPLAASDIVTFAGDLSSDQPAGTVTFTLASDTLGDLSQLEMRLAPSIEAGLLDALDDVAGYPHGGLEQTMGRVLPNAVAAQALDQIGLRRDVLEEELPAMIDLGLQALYGFQHSDGGWGWQRKDASGPEQTAYVLFGLALTRQSGFEVDSAVVERGIAALQAMLPEADLRTQAYAAYVLTTIGQPVTTTLSLTEALSLDLFSQAALAIALDASGDVSGTQALVDNLSSVAVQDATTVHWPEGVDDPTYTRSVMGSTVRTTAMVADTLARLDPASPLLPAAIRWLMNQRQGQGWGDPQKNSYAILALTDYLLTVEEPGQAIPFQIYVNDMLWQTGRLDPTLADPTLVLTYGIPSALGAAGAEHMAGPTVPSTPSTAPAMSPTLTTTEGITAGETITASRPVTITAPLTVAETISTTEIVTGSKPITPTQTVTETESTASGVTPATTLLRVGENTIHLVFGAPGEIPQGNLYYAITLTTMRPPPGETFPARQSEERSIAIEREYSLQASPGPTTSFQRGDLVQVNLTLNVPDDAWYVLVDDPLPAGFEAIDSSLSVSGLETATVEEPAIEWQKIGDGLSQLHDDRVAFLLTHLAPGRHTYSYLARATSTGSFTAMPTQVYSIYERDVWSQSESVRVHVEPR